MFTVILSQLNQRVYELIKSRNQIRFEISKGQYAPQEMTHDVIISSTITANMEQNKV